MIIKPEKFTPIAFEGLSILDLTDGVDTEISIARISLMPRAQHRRSVAKQCEKYYYVLFGKVDFTLTDNVFNLKAGELCLVRKGQAFSYANPTDEPVELLLILPFRFKPEAEFFEE